VGLWRHPRRSAAERVLLGVAWGAVGVLTFVAAAHFVWLGLPSDPCILGDSDCLPDPAVIAVRGIPYLVGAVVLAAFTLAWFTATRWAFYVPPGWPAPPQGWTPRTGWRPDPNWPAPPVSWQPWRRTIRVSARDDDPPQT
jgi:hypothetical protein